MTITVAERPAATSGAADRTRSLALPALVGILLISAALRLWGAATQSIWYDEAVTLLLASRPPAEIVRRTMDDTLPPFSYLVLHPWLALGDGELWWRYPSIGFGVLTVALVYRLGVVVNGRRGGTIAALFVAVSPFFVFYGQEIRLYALLGALTAAYLVLSVDSAARRWSIPLAGLFGTLALYTHPLSGLIMPLPFLLSLRDRRTAIRRAWILLFAALGFVPWLVVLGSQTTRVMSSFWADSPSILRPLVSLVVWVFGPPTSIIAIACGLVWLLGLLGIALVRMRVDGRSPGMWFALTLALAPPLLLFCLSQIHPIYLDRVLTGSALALCVLLGIVIGRLPAAPRALVLAVWCAFATLGLWTVVIGPSGQKPPLRDAAQFLMTTAGRDDIVLHTSDGSHHPFLVYAPGLRNVLLAGDPEYSARSPRGVWTLNVMGYRMVELDDVPKDKPNSVWLVVALDHSEAWQTEVAALIDRRWKRITERRFGGIVVRQYAPEVAGDGS